MAYVILDPVGPYPRHLMEFLSGKLGMDAVAVFTSEMRLAVWRGKWSKHSEQYVVEAHSPRGVRAYAALADDLRGRHRVIEGVVPWDEETVLPGARLGEFLGLDWNPVRVMERCRDKAVMKAWLRRHGGVRVNASATVTDREEALAFQRRVGRWPIVVKPTAGSGSEDVHFPDDEDSLLRDCERVRKAGSGEVLLEEFVGGPEIVVNGVVDSRGDLLVTDQWHYDRRTVNGVPNLFHTTRSIASHEPVFVPAARYAAQVVEALGLRRAPIHMEVKVDDRGPCLIEVGARFGGGNLPILASRLHGRSLLELGACQYVSDVPLSGGDIDLGRYDSREARVLHGVQSVALPRIHAVHGADVVRALPSFNEFAVLRAVGAPAPQTRDLDSAAWELSLIHSDRRQLEADCEIAHRVLRYS